VENLWGSLSEEELAEIIAYANANREPVYYVDQTNWDHDDFYYLNRYLNRLLYRAGNQKDKKQEEKITELQTMDLSRMTEETKVILYVLIFFNKMEYVFEWENFTSLKDTKPLKKRLNLVENPMGVYALYTEYNIGW